MPCHAMDGTAARRPAAHEWQHLLRLPSLLLLAIMRK